MSTEHDKIHACGAERHPQEWLSANIRACEGAAASGLVPYNEPGKTAIPRIVLRVLDGLKVEAGLMFDKQAKEWKQKPIESLSP